MNIEEVLSTAPAAASAAAMSGKAFHWKVRMYSG